MKFGQLSFLDFLTCGRQLWSSLQPLVRVVCLDDDLLWWFGFHVFCLSLVPFVCVLVVVLGLFDVGCFGLKFF